MSYFFKFFNLEDIFHVGSTIRSTENYFQKLAHYQAAIY